MKRHPALVPLSRDHHHALLLASQLRRASAGTAAALAGLLLAQWDDEERVHFRVEEEILLPAYAEHGAPDEQAIVQMLIDHMLIRADITAISDAPQLERLHRLGERLVAHVRLEEREVFPLIERSIPEPELRALGARLAAAVPSSPEPLRVRS